VKNEMYHIGHGTYQNNNLTLAEKHHWDIEENPRTNNNLPQS